MSHVSSAEFDMIEIPHCVIHIGIISLGLRISQLPTRQIK